MSASRAVLISTRIVALVGVIFIAIAAPAAEMTVSVADGESSQTPATTTPDGNSWGG